MYLPNLKTGAQLFLTLVPLKKKSSFLFLSFIKLNWLFWELFLSLHQTASDSRLIALLKGEKELKAGRYTQLSQSFTNLSVNEIFGRSFNVDQSAGQRQFQWRRAIKATKLVYVILLSMKLKTRQIMSLGTIQLIYSSYNFSKFILWVNCLKAWRLIF